MADEEKQTMETEQAGKEATVDEIGTDEALSQDAIDSLMGAKSPEEVDQEELARQWASELGSQDDAEQDAQEEVSVANDVEVEKPNFSNLSENGAQHSTRNLDFILDIPLQLTVEMGSAKMLINDLLKLGQGSVIELNKQAGDPLDILVNSKLIARGEVVVVGEKFGIRLTDIVSPLERVKRLQ